MSRRIESSEEWEAKWLVAAVLQGLPERRSGAGHDYDIRVDDQLVALEVTTSTIQEVKALDAALRSHQQRPCPLITSDWALSIVAAAPGDPGTDVRAIFADAPAPLRILEEHNVAAFGRGFEEVLKSADDSVRTSVASLLGLGLLGGTNIGPPSQGRGPVIVIGSIGKGGPIDPNDLNRTVERVAARKARQLGGAVADERHLFIVIEATNYAAHAAISVGPHLPTSPPRLPPGIDTVWIGTWAPWHLYGSDIASTCRVTPPSAWQRVEQVDAHQYAASHGEAHVKNARDQAREALRQQLNERARALRARLHLR